MIKLKADCRAGAVALLVLRGLSACSDNTSQASQDTALEESQNAWAQREPDQYVVQVCSLGIEPPGCVRAAIDGESVVAAEERIFHPGVPWWEAIDLKEKPLDRMFDRLRAGTVDECAVADVQYDSKFDYVERYTLDCEGTTIGGQWVACFKPDTLDLSVCEVVP